MKDKLRELAERWKIYGSHMTGHECADELLAILDAEGDGGAVAWMSPNKECLEFSRPDTVYGSHTIPLYTHPARSGVVSDEDVDAACFAAINLNAVTMTRHTRASYAEQMDFRKAMRAALEHFAKGERHER